MACFYKSIFRTQVAKLVRRRVEKWELGGKIIDVVARALPFASFIFFFFFAPFAIFKS